MSLAIPVPIEKIVFFNDQDNELRIERYPGGIFCVDTVKNTRKPIASYPIIIEDGIEKVITSFVEVDNDAIWELTALGECLYSFLIQEGEKMERCDLIAEFNFDS